MLKFNTIHCKLQVKGVCVCGTRSIEIIRTYTFAHKKHKKCYVFLCECACVARACVDEGMRMRASARPCICVGVQVRVYTCEHVGLLMKYATLSRHILCFLSGSTTFFHIIS